MKKINFRGGVQEITREQYNEMLNCLPPRIPYSFIEGYNGQFLMGEPYIHINFNDKFQPLYAHFGYKGKKYYFLGLTREKPIGHRKTNKTIEENWDIGWY